MAICSRYLSGDRYVVFVVPWNSNSCIAAYVPTVHRESMTMCRFHPHRSHSLEGFPRIGVSNPTGIHVKGDNNGLASESLAQTCK